MGVGIPTNNKCLPASCHASYASSPIYNFIQSSVNYCHIRTRNQSICMECVYYKNKE